MRTTSLALQRFAVLLALVAVGIRAHAAVPELKGLFPPGGQRGTTVSVAVEGKFEPWPIQVWTNEPGLTVAAAAEKETLSITIDPDVSPGHRWLRCYNAEGTSSLQPFVVGTLAEAVETEPNNAPSTAQKFPTANQVVSGKLATNGDVDVFQIPLTAGQTLVASLAGHEALGSPMDAVLHIVSPEGRQLAYNHDGRGLDPEIVFTAPAAGDYMVRIFGFPSAPNSTIGFSGSDRHAYRLTLSTNGFVDYPWPLAVTSAQEATVALVGWNVPESLVTLKVNANQETTSLADNALANSAIVRVETHPALIESEPNSLDAPQTVSMPSTVTGRIADRVDLDGYSFPGKQGQSLELQLESRTLGYPLDGVLQIFDAAGKSLARIDDVGAARDPSTVFAPPSDGTYRVTISDLNGAGSPRHVYRLRIVPALSDFEVTANADAYTAVADKPTEITLTIDRRHGFSEEISFEVSGLPPFITAAAAKSAADGESAKTVKLVLTSGGGAFSGPIRIVAKALGASQKVRTVTALTSVPPMRLPDLWLTATAK